MKSAKLGEILYGEVTDTSIYWINAINEYMHRHNITQEQLADRLHLVQSTLSKKLNAKNVGNTLKTYWYLPYQDATKICKAMDSTLGAVTYEYDQRNRQIMPSPNNEEYFKQSGDVNIPVQCETIPSGERTVYPSCLFMNDASLVNNKADPMFTPWFGTFHCYFFSTISTENRCFHGILEIPESPREGCCNVKFSFEYGRKKSQVKDYYGQLVLSRKPNSGAYCTLVNHDDLGEITYLLMANPVVNSGCVCCVVALVSTISGGKGTKHPCAERMIISRVELDGVRFELVKAHLQLNDKNIYITEQAFMEMLDDDRIPQEFKQRYGVHAGEQPFDKLPLSSYLTRTAAIPESWIKSLINFSEEEQQKIIDLFRLYSSAPKYNKIKQKTVEFDIFNLFREEYEPWTLPQDLDN